MKFADLPYHRPDMEQIRSRLCGLTEEFARAAHPADQVRFLKEFIRVFVALSDTRTLCAIRNSMDMQDAFYLEEETFFNHQMPLVDQMLAVLGGKILASPHRCAIAAEFGDIFIENLVNLTKSFDPDVLDLIREENQLVLAYQSLIAGLSTEWEGKPIGLNALVAMMGAGIDRDRRRDAGQATSVLLRHNQEALDQLFDRLVRNRTEQARRMGFESFTQLGYVRRNRNCYTSEDIRRFRQRIEQLVVPAVSIIKKSQSDRLGLDAIRLYDDVVFYEGTGGGGIVKARLLESLQGLFGSLSPTAGGYIRQMLEGRYYDLDARPGKKASSSCKYLPDRKIPFVFANFNGQTADVFLVIHEFGHGFSHYLTRQDPYAPVKPPTLDLCEVHSMGMEMLASPGGYGIFGREDRGQAEAAHLMDAFCFLPYGAMVDEFQHIIYEKPEMRPAQRNRCWLELEEKYRPHLDLSDLEYFAGGRGWQKQHHIYVSPFYYIDYCLAQITAFELWDEGRKDPGAAFRKYTAIAASGGDLNFCETLAKAGLKGPFASAALGNIILSVLDAIQKSPLPLIPDPNASLSKRPAP